MKKTIAILLVLVIGMAGVFAAFTNTVNQNLIISTAISTVNAFKITTTDESLNAFYTVFGTTGEENPTDATRIIDIEDTEDGLTTAAYLTIGTNNPAGFTVYLQSASQLSKDDNSSKIDYSISVGDATWDTSEAHTAGVSVGSVLANGAAEVESKQIKVTIDPVTYYNAEATTEGETYMATVIFNISAS
jgi:hypothetical protein